MERMNVQLIAPGLKIKVAEWSEPFRAFVVELSENAAVPCKSFKVAMALTVKVGTHLFDLKIGHITKAPCEGALVISLATEIESFD